LAVALFVRYTSRYTNRTCIAAQIFRHRGTWGQLQVTTEDWSMYQRLSQPESPDFILNQPDYYAFYTYALFQARVAKL